MHACLRAMSACSRSGSPHDDLHRTGLCLLVCDCWSGVGTVVEPEWVLAVLTAIRVLASFKIKGGGIGPTYKSTMYRTERI